MKFLNPAADRRLRILGLALMIGTTLLDLGVLVILYLAPNTVRASDSNFVANPEANGKMLINLAQQSGKPCDLIFIGASNVEYWGSEGKVVWDHYYAPRHAFNFGVRGDKTENVLWRFDHMPLGGLNPKVGVIFIGLNNFTSTPRELTMGIKAVVKRTKATFPGIKILLVSLTPNERDKDTVIATNKMLQAYADNTTIFYIDLYSKLGTKEDGWKGLRSDHLHLTAEGYQIWAEQMEPLMQTFLGPIPYAARELSLADVATSLDHTIH